MLIPFVIGVQPFSATNSDLLRIATAEEVRTPASGQATLFIELSTGLLSVMLDDRTVEVIQ